jgi:hypothetical protein
MGSLQGLDAGAGPGASRKCRGCKKKAKSRKWSREQKKRGGRGRRGSREKTRGDTLWGTIQKLRALAPMVAVRD